VVVAHTGVINDSRSRKSVEQPNENSSAIRDASAAPAGGWERGGGLSQVT
jgi:hypothetical protein